MKKQSAPVQTSIPGCDESEAPVVDGCIRCKKPRQNNEPFFRLFFFMHTLGVKPRSASKPVTALLCPKCSRNIPESPLEQMFYIGGASKKLAAAKTLALTRKLRAKG